MRHHPYVETFDHGPGGWIGWNWKTATGAAAIEVRDGCAISYSPWWIDYNHAPPGAGYLHILFALHLCPGPGLTPQVQQVGGANPYVDGGFPIDLTNACVTVRLRGDLQPRGAQLLLLAQGNVSDDPAHPNWVNQVLTAQPLHVAEQWSQQSITLVPDQRQWTNLGSRHDRRGFYGAGSIDQLLRRVNGDIIFVLFPLDVRPAAPLTGDPHQQRAGEDYPVLAEHLPQGRVELDTVSIAYPD